MFTIDYFVQHLHKDIFFIIGISFIIWIAWHLTYKRLSILVNKTKFHWDNLVLDAFKIPISVLIWSWPAIISLDFFLKIQFNFKTNWSEKLKLLLISISFIWIAIRIINNTEKYTLMKKNKDATTLQITAKVARLFFIAIGILIIMQSFGLSLSGVLTLSGISGLIVGLAAKDLLSNFFGGLMIYFDRPFKINDWIRSPDRQIEGTVESIGWRITIIRTFDKRPIYVPNSVFSNIVVENPSRMFNRRINENIGIRYEDGKKIVLIIPDIKSMLMNHPEIDAKQTLIVSFNAFGPSSLDLLVYTFTKTINWVHYHEVKQDILLKIMNIIYKYNADIAFPTQTLKLESKYISD
ncbi:inner membrane protein [Candidatus Photodesmus katoptron]|uniref:Mechanosensitive ion channel n=1 Tax=Candidatus Photodesmus katoptron Akat1 TaxID=1236703 RepID=S3DKN2_9GAMM|nr:mechanosensitive ion channel family protein [Candidatus Photodesmus katoptron]EPE37684.1 mechanosensitive ion channel [Candidatus Photodesmus katoptron Akat1]KEY90595.1 inner membrane protein [Candidatus Photodesmus katoptron]